jgi:hypothetical protein
MDQAREPELAHIAMDDFFLTKMPKHIVGKTGSVSMVFHMENTKAGFLYLTL